MYFAMLTYTSDKRQAFFYFLGLILSFGHSINILSIPNVCSWLTFYVLNTFLHPCHRNRTLQFIAIKKLTFTFFKVFITYCYIVNFRVESRTWMYIYIFIYYHFLLEIVLFVLWLKRISFWNGLNLVIYTKVL